MVILGVRGVECSRDCRICYGPNPRVAELTITERERRHGSLPTRAAAVDIDSYAAQGAAVPVQRAAPPRATGGDELGRTSKQGLTAMIGTTICDGRYVVVEEVGRGGMGVVYKATDTRLNIPVAI